MIYNFPNNRILVNVAINSITKSSVNILFASWTHTYIVLTFPLRSIFLMVLFDIHIQPLDHICYLFFRGKYYDGNDGGWLMSLFLFPSFHIFLHVIFIISVIIHNHMGAYSTIECRRPLVYGDCCSE